MDNQSVRGIFARLGLPAPQKFTKIAVGFTNEVYALDDRYVLKVCILPENEEPFAREISLYRFFEGQLPVPRVLHYDHSKSLVDHDYSICFKLPGQNLYNVWHTYTPRQRAGIIDELCRMLRQINATDPAALPPGTVPPLTNWKDYIAGKIEGHLSACERAGTLSREFAAAVRAYVSDNIGVLDQSKVALTFWDAHFDNILVDHGHISGLIDFERTELTSIDYSLDLVRRMVRKPTKYMSDYAKQFARDEDYANLMDLYRDYYPELFDFDDLDVRLNLYEIAHDLRDLELWPELTPLAAGLARIVKSPVDI